jgi:hypothetical protein
MLAIMAQVATRIGKRADEYLDWEREQPIRHEYSRGEVFARAGGMRHPR